MNEIERDRTDHRINLVPQGTTKQAIAMGYRTNYTMSKNSKIDFGGGLEILSQITIVWFFRLLTL